MVYYYSFIFFASMGLNMLVGSIGYVRSAVNVGNVCSSSVPARKVNKHRIEDVNKNGGKYATTASNFTISRRGTACISYRRTHHSLGKVCVHQGMN